MNKFVFGALAFSASSLCFANESEDWPTLDREIEYLATSLNQGAGGIGLSGFVRSSYASSSDIAVGGNDLGGFSMDNIRLNLTGAVGNFNVFIEMEGSTDVGFGSLGGVGGGGAVGVLDAWTSLNVTEQIAMTMGQFRPPFLGDGLRGDDQLLFIDRTISGDTWAARDAGLMFSGNFDALGWWISGTNGVTGAGDDLALTARVAFNAMGTGVGAVEGAYGAGDESNLTLAAGYYDDGFISDGSGISFEADYTRGAMAAAFSLISYDDGLAIARGIFPGTDTPWDATFSFMFAPDTWEAAIRYDDFDDTAETTMITLGVNRYVEGHAAKWQLNYSTIDSDVAGFEADVVQFGLTVSV